MYELILIAIYTALVLIFVPLGKIGKAQTAVRKWVMKLKDKIKD